MGKLPVVDFPMLKKIINMAQNVTVHVNPYSYIICMDGNYAMTLIVKATVIVTHTCGCTLIHVHAWILLTSMQQTLS